VSQDKEKFCKELEQDLVKSYGHLIANKELCMILGFKNMPALRQCMLRGQLPVPVFSLENRRGRFALSKDVALWLTDKRFEAIEQTEGGNND